MSSSSSTENIIEIKNGVIRQQKDTILKDINIEIKQGEFVYIIGKVGSGKSSFLKTIYAELPFKYGFAKVANFSLKSLKRSQIPHLRRKCGIVFQDFKLLIDRNVNENLKFALKATGWKSKKEINKRIDDVLDMVDMSHKKFAMSHQLSGGEQQRIVLARALLNVPPIIIADEPTGNIDPETSYKIIELLRQICDSGKTVIISTHQYNLIEKYPGRILICEDGQIQDITDSYQERYAIKTTATTPIYEQNEEDEKELIPYTPQQVTHFDYELSAPQQTEDYKIDEEIQETTTQDTSHLHIDINELD